MALTSIKRVEILGAMQTRYPDLPKLKPEELAELRTLGQIVEHIGGKLGASSTVAPVAVAPAVATPPPAPAPMVNVVPVAVVASGVDLAELTQTLMEVVSEKTGYPVETLEPAMDMESDLGIDSIKRVEILGAMQTRYPDLPKLKPEELAELRTLGQIVEHIGGKLGASTTAPAAVAQAVTATAEAVTTVVPEASRVGRNAVRLKALPIPDILEANLPDGFIALLTNDGTPATGETCECSRRAQLARGGNELPANGGKRIEQVPVNIPQVTLPDLSEDQSGANTQEHRSAIWTGRRIHPSQPAF